jgi:hypothetical protein
MQESREQRGVTFSAYYDAMHDADYLLQDEMMNPVAFITFSNQDTMYFHQAMKAPDRKQFTQAIIKEVKITLRTRTGSSFQETRSQKAQQSYLLFGQ